MYAYLVAYRKDVGTLVYINFICDCVFNTLSQLFNRKNDKNKFLINNLHCTILRNLLSNLYFSTNFFLLQGPDFEDSS